MPPRITSQTLRVAAALLENPEVPRYGLELSKAADLKSGTIYPALARMEQAGWIESKWEVERAEDLGRPRRRLYRLTGLGESVLHQALEDELRAIQRSAQSRPLLPGRPRTA